jgi:hypothetical protein
MTDTIVDTHDAHETLKQQAKALGIKQAHLMKPETLEKRIAEANRAPVEIDADSIDVQLGDFGKKYLDSIGFELDWFQPVAVQYSIDKFEYLHKFRAFRAYRQGIHVDWITINDFGLLNGKRNMVVIMLKHQEPHTSRRVFDFNWRV